MVNRDARLIGHLLGTSWTMSNEIYGFAVFLDCPDPPSLLDALRHMTPLGVFAITEDQLIGFPGDLTPKSKSVPFLVGDRPDSRNAEYVLDYQDYDPAAEIGLPAKAEERLSLLANLFRALFDDFNCIRIVVALTQCSQIDTVKSVSHSLLPLTLRGDCTVNSPPNALYIITP